MKSKNFSTVTELTAKIKDLLENNFFNVFVKGEISNFIHHGSGHMYFILKDRNSEIKSVMFRGSNQNLNFQPANGVEVFLQGKISLYEARGQYQIIVSEMKPEGIGEKNPSDVIVKLNDGGFSKIYSAILLYYYR